MNFILKKTSAFASHFKATALLALLISLTFSCSPETLKPEEGDPSAQKFQVWMTDSPANYEDFNVDIAKVEVYAEGQGWIGLETEMGVYDVTELTNGAEAMIASSAKLEAGVYSYARITFGTENEVVIDGEVNSLVSALDLGLDAGLGLNLGLTANATGQTTLEIPIQVTYNGEADAKVLLDFNVAKSAVDTLDEKVFTPFMTWIEDTRTGVQGKIEATFETGSNIYFTLENADAEITGYANAEGEFLMRGLEEGTYEMIIEVLNESGELQTFTVEEVIVVEGEIRQMGTLTIGSES